MIEVSNNVVLSGLVWVRETASVLKSLRVDVTFRPMDLSSVHHRRAFRQRARGFQGNALLVQVVERPHALGDHELYHHENANAAAHSVWLLWGLDVAQIPRADVVMGLLAPKLLLDVFAQLRQRREAIPTAAVVVDVERINVYEAFVFKVDDGETEVAGDPVRSHQHLDFVAQPAAKASAGAKSEKGKGGRNRVR